MHKIEQRIQNGYYKTRATAEASIKRSKLPKAEKTRLFDLLKLIKNYRREGEFQPSGVITSPAVSVNTNSRQQQLVDADRITWQIIGFSLKYKFDSVDTAILALAEHIKMNVGQ